MASMFDFYSNGLHRVLVLLTEERSFHAGYSQGYFFVHVQSPLVATALVMTDCSI